MFKLSTKQILTAMKYEPVPVLKNLFKTINKKDTFSTKIQIDWFDSDRIIGQDDYFDDAEDDGQTRSNKMDISKVESHNELNSQQQLGCMELNTMFHQENQIILTVGSSKYMSVSMIKLNGITITNTFLQDLFIQYLHKAVILIVCLQRSLLVSLHNNILRHLYKDISTVVFLLSSLLTSLRSEFCTIISTRISKK